MRGVDKRSSASVCSALARERDAGEAEAPDAVGATMSRYMVEVRLI